VPASRDRREAERAEVVGVKVYDAPTRRADLEQRIRKLRALRKTSPDPALRRTARRALQQLAEELAELDRRIADQR